MTSPYSFSAMSLCVLAAAGLTLAHCHHVSADDALDASALVQSGDRLVATGDERAAIARYVLALALEPESRSAIGRLVNVLAARRGISSMELHALPLPQLAIGELGPAGTEAIDRVQRAARIAGNGFNAPQHASITVLETQLPTASQFQEIQGGDSSRILAFLEAIRAVRADTPVIRSSSARTRLDGRLFASVGSLRRALRLAAALEELSTAVSAMAQTKQVPTDRATRMGADLFVRAAAVRNALSSIRSIQSETNPLPMDVPDLLALHAARSFPTAPVQSGQFAKRQIRIAGDRSAWLMHARSAFNPSDSGDAAEGLSSFARARQTPQGQSLLEPDRWLNGRYSGAAAVESGHLREAILRYERALAARPEDFELLDQLRAICPDADSALALNAELCRRRGTAFLVRRAWDRSRAQLQLAPGDALTQALKAIVELGQDGSPAKRQVAVESVAGLRVESPALGLYGEALLMFAENPTARRQIMVRIDSAVDSGLPPNSFERQVCRWMKSDSDLPDAATPTWLAAE